ncbi:MAG: hypothetical protein ACR2OU_14185 [Thermomicrobiales bacterium]
MTEPIVAAGSWNRPEPLSTIGFTFKFLMYTLGGVGIWNHRLILTLSF